MEEELAWRAPETIPNEAGLEIMVLFKTGGRSACEVIWDDLTQEHCLREMPNKHRLSIGTVKGWLPLASLVPPTAHQPLERWLAEGKALLAALPRQETELREKYLKVVDILAKIRDRLTSYEGDVNLLTLMGEITAMVVRPEEAKDIVEKQRANARDIVAKAKELELERKRASRLHAQLVACGVAARGEEGSSDSVSINDEAWSPVYQVTRDLRRNYTDLCAEKVASDVALQKAEKDNAAVRERLRQANKERDRYVEERNALVDALLKASGEKNPGSLQGWLALISQHVSPQTPTKPAGWVVRAKHPEHGIAYAVTERGSTASADHGIPPYVFATRIAAQAIADSSGWHHKWTRTVLPVDAAGNVIEPAGVAWEASRSYEEAERLRAELATWKRTAEQRMERIRSVKAERDDRSARCDAAETDVARLTKERDSAEAERDRLAAEVQRGREQKPVRWGPVVRDHGEVIAQCEEALRRCSLRGKDDALLAALAALRGAP